MFLPSENLDVNQIAVISPVDKCDIFTKREQYLSCHRQAGVIEEILVHVFGTNDPFPTITKEDFHLHGCMLANLKGVLKPFDEPGPCSGIKLFSYKGQKTLQFSIVKRKGTPCPPTKTTLVRPGNQLYYQWIYFCFCMKNNIILNSCK